MAIIDRFAQRWYRREEEQRRTAQTGPPRVQNMTPAALQLYAERRVQELVSHRIGVLIPIQIIIERDEHTFCYIAKMKFRVNGDIKRIYFRFGEDITFTHLDEMLVEACNKAHREMVREQRDIEEMYRDAFYQWTTRPGQAVRVDPNTNIVWKPRYAHVPKTPEEKFWDEVKKWKP